MADVKRVEPLFAMPPVNHLMPTDSVFEKPKAEDGSAPLRNRKREAFCVALTGWGGEGRRIKNYIAYEIAYGKGGATARSESTHLLAIPEVKARVEYLERKVEEAKRHDYLAAQHDIDELRLGVIERARNNDKLVPLALVASRDFERAHGLDQRTAAPSGETTVEETRTLELKREIMPGISEILKKVVKTTK